MKGFCEICGADIEVIMCCSGHECGCMGQPIEPPVCSEDCFIQFMERRKLSQYINRQIIDLDE